MREGVLITAFGRGLTATEWSRETGLKRGAIQQRIDRGLDPEEALAVARVEELSEFWPGANALPFDADGTARAVVRFCAPLTLETVGAILGLTRERVRQIEQDAFARFARALLDDTGLDRDEVLDMLNALNDMRAARTFLTARPRIVGAREKAASDASNQEAGHAE